MRTFIALEPGAALTDRLEVVLRRNARLAPQSRWVRPDSLHLTLAYLGEVAEAVIPPLGESVALVAARHPPLILRVQGSGTFGPMDRPRVLWLGITGDLDALAALQRELVRALAPLGLAPDHAQFIPHLTLARAKSPRGDEDLARCADALRDADLGELPVHELALFASRTDREGMHYAPIAAHRLGAGA